MSFLISENDTLLTKSQSASPRRSPWTRRTGEGICQVEISKKEVSKGILGGRVALQARSQSFKVKDGLVTG